MELKLKSTGSTAGFVSWLKGFKDIQPSLIIEMDLETSEFIAKSFPQDKSIVKYSKISFEDAGYELVSITDSNGEAFDWANHDKLIGPRVKLAVYSVLSKVCDVANTFDGAEHSVVVKFDVCNSVVYMGTAEAVKEYQATNTIFVSKSLTMSIKNSQISEFFQKCDDDTFLNRVCNIASPSTYSVDAAVLSNLSKISGLFASSGNQHAHDTIKFYSKVVDGQRGLYAFDESNGTFDYLLGYYEAGQDGDTATIVFKDNFLNATKGLTAETLQVTLDTAGASRILVSAGDSKVVIAAAKLS